MATEVTARKAVWRHLLETPVVTALVGERIYHQVRPDGAQYPCVVLFTVSSTPRRDLHDVAWTETRLQITAMGLTEPSAEAVALAVHQALEGFSGVMAGALYVIDCQVGAVYPDYQEESGQTHYHVDVVVTHK